jgi:hypothetical protein
MAHHRYPICPISGKLRYGERKDIKLALREADRDRARARLNDVPCSRRETRFYRCSDCHGWHLTSQQARPLRLVPATQLAVRIPEHSVQARQRAVAALTAGTAA